MVRPWHLAVAAVAALLAGLAALWGRVGFGVGALLVAALAAAWCWVLVRSDHGGP